MPKEAKESQRKPIECSQRMLSNSNSLKYFRKNKKQYQDEPSKIPNPLKELQNISKNTHLVLSRCSQGDPKSLLMHFQSNPRAFSRHSQDIQKDCLPRPLHFQNFHKANLTLTLPNSKNLLGT